jgi:hypothetical protein
VILRVLLGAALGATALGSLLVACGQQPVSLSSDPMTSDVSDPAVDGHAPVPPFTIVIPAIGVDSVLEPLGLTADRELAIPPASAPEVAGWYAGPDTVEPGDECMPGSVCSAVVVGHVNGTGPDGERGFPGVFADLAELAPGDEVLVERADGSTVRFVVESVESVDKDELPTDIYTLTDRPRLNLVTCDDAAGFGTERAGHYDRNVLVRTVLAS